MSKDVNGCVDAWRVEKLRPAPRSPKQMSEINGDEEKQELGNYGLKSKQRKLLISSVILHL